MESKHRYDITMSKRTRKPLMNLPEANQKEDGQDQGENDNGQDGEGDRKSLKQLINGRSSLGQHFSEEEKQLQMVRKQKQSVNEAVKLRGMVGRYVKVLSHLIKMKRDSSRRIKPRTIYDPIKGQ